MFRRILFFSVAFSALLDAINPITAPLENTSAQIDAKNPVELTPEAESDQLTTQEQPPQSTPEKTLWSMAMDFEFLGIFGSIMEKFGKIVKDTISVVKVFFGFDDKLDTHKPAIEAKDDVGVRPPPVPDSKTTEPNSPNPVARVTATDAGQVDKRKHIIHLEETAIYKDGDDWLNNTFDSIPLDATSKKFTVCMNFKEIKWVVESDLNAPIENPQPTKNGLLGVAKNPKSAHLKVL